MKIIKKILESFLKFVLLTALLHIGVMIFRVFKEGNVKLLNYFAILDLNAFWPEITEGLWSDVLSIVLMLIIFLGFLILSLIKKAKVKKS